MLMSGGANCTRSSTSPLRMKTHLRSVFLTLLAVVFVTGCDKTPSGTPPPQAPPPRIRAAIPTDHLFDFETGFSARDLTHGNGVFQLTVARRWKGTETMEMCFGRGWADQNAIRLTLVSENILILWRGGVGSNIAHKNGESGFRGDADETSRNADAAFISKVLRARGRTNSPSPTAGSFPRPMVGIVHFANWRKQRMGLPKRPPEDAPRFCTRRAGRENLSQCRLTFLRPKRGLAAVLCVATRQTGRGGTR